MVYMKLSHAQYYKYLKISILFLTLSMYSLILSFQVSNATCDYTPENRVMLNMTYKRETRTRDFRWDQMSAGYGWIYTLQCMAVK